MSETANRNKKASGSKIPLFISAGFIVCMLACYFLWPAFHDVIKEAFKTLSSGDRDRIREWVSQFGVWGPAIIVLAMVLQMFLFVINVVLLMVVAVLAYGPIWGSVIAVAGILTASTIGYFVGSLLGEHAICRLMGDKTENKMYEFVDKYGFWAIIVVRISPFLSDDAIGFVAGISKMRYFKFITATFIGILPLTILIAWLSTDIDKMKTGLIWVSIVSIAGLVIYIIYDRTRKKKSIA